MDAKRDYLVKELWILAWNASVQRANLYKKGIEHDSKDTRLFRENVINYLSSQIIPLYSEGPITEEQHYMNIEDLIAYANRFGERVLGPLGYKYGVAQKLLNLVLKYHWCLGVIGEPPHCPVDRIVIDKTNYKGTSWTKIGQRSEYWTIIEDIKRLAGKESLAVWELSSYSRR